jgi:hypothetical protein
MSEKPDDLLVQAGKRGVPALMPYLWTLVFIIALLALIHKRGLDWWTAGFGVLVTASILIVLFVIRQIVNAPRKEVRCLAITSMWFFMVLFAASLTLFVTSAFFGHPLDFRPSPTPTEDEGRAAIYQFYKLIDKRDFKAAWDLIHKKRKAETKLDWEEFAKAYTTTREHNHLQIERIQTPFAIDRTYRVSFAVRDELPVNHLYRSRATLVKDWFEGHSLGRHKIVGLIISDVKNQFEVPRELEPTVVEFVEARRFESLFKPDIIFDIGRELRLAERKAPLASPDNVWRYFVQVVHLQEEQPGSWKITSGLYPRLVEATYEPGASAP